MTDTMYVCVIRPIYCLAGFFAIVGIIGYELFRKYNPKKAIE